MIRHRRRFRAGAGAAAAFALVTALAVATSGRPAEAKSRQTYLFMISRVDLAEGVPGEVEAQAVARLDAAIEAHAELEAAPDQGAPDPDAEPQKFKEYLKARRQRAFKVNVEISRYAVEVEAGDGSRAGAGQYVTVRVALRLFGEAIPDRVMAFTGEGSATAKLEVGKTVRPRDREEASSAALDQAIAGAIAESLEKLKQPPPTQKKKPKKK